MKTIRNSFFLISILVICSCNKKEEDVSSVLQKAQQTIEELDNFQYLFDYESLSPFTDKLHKQKGVASGKVIDDPLHFYHRVEDENSIEAYNGEYLYTLKNKNSDTVAVHSVDVLGSPKLYDGVTFRSWFEKDYFTSFLKDSAVVSAEIIKDPDIEIQEPTISIRLKYKDTRQYENYEIIYQFLKSSYFPVYRKVSYDLPQGVFINRTIISEIKTNYAQPKELYTIKGDYVFSHIKPPRKFDDIKPITGTDIVSFNATTSEGSEVSLSKYYNKLMLLDFWFLNCAPCLNNMPLLAKIQDEFTSDLNIVGINSIDTLEKIRKFEKRNNYNFINLKPIKKSDLEFYNIYTYPTLMLVDTEGKIRKKYNADTKNLYTALKKDIKSILSEN